MKLLKILLAILIFSAVVPSISFAANAYTAKSPWDISTLKGPLVTCTGNYLSASGNGLLPKCTDLCDLFYTIINFIYFMMAFAIWIIIPISFVVAGFLLLTSRGNPEAQGKAKKMMTGAVMGTVVLLCSYLIVATFVNFFQLTNFVGYFGTANTGSGCQVQSYTKPVCGPNTFGACPDPLTQICQNNGNGNFTCVDSN